MTAVRIRRTLCTAMFDKVTRLSSQSLLKTNSGKLVSLISSDLFAIERAMVFMSLIFVTPIVNCLAYGLIWYTLGWQSALIVFVCLTVAFVIQIVTGRWTKKFRGLESRITDSRVKMINDIVVGVRTIKCDGWEDHYLDRLRKVRQRQVPIIFKLLLTQNFGITLYIVSATMSIFLIMLNKWF